MTEYQQRMSRLMVDFLAAPCPVPEDTEIVRGNGRETYIERWDGGHYTLSCHGVYYKVTSLDEARELAGKLTGYELLGAEDKAAVDNWPVS